MIGVYLPLEAPHSDTKGVFTPLSERYFGFSNVGGDGLQIERLIDGVLLDVDVILVDLHVDLLLLIIQYDGHPSLQLFNLNTSQPTITMMCRYASLG